MQRHMNTVRSFCGSVGITSALLTVALSCISAPTIVQRLTALDKDTDVAVSVRDSAACQADTICTAAANACISDTAQAAWKCKESNDAADGRQSLAVQTLASHACKAALKRAEINCAPYRKHVK